MPGLFLSLIACLVVTIAGREQLRVARLADGLGPAPPLFVAIAISAIASSALAAWLGSLLAPMMPAAGKQMFLALALLLAGLEVALLRAGKKPAEPTRSFGAILVVLFSAQLTDAARFLVLALAVATAEPVPAAIGGALGSGIALCMAAGLAGQWEARVPTRIIGWTVGGLLVLIALVLGLSARGAFG